MVVCVRESNSIVAFERPRLKTSLARNAGPEHRTLWRKSPTIHNTTKCAIKTAHLCGTLDASLKIFDL